MHLHLDIVTPEKTVFSGEVSFVYLPGASGEFGVLPQHTTLLATLVPGELRYGDHGEIKFLAIGGGFAEVVDDRVTVLTDLALEEIKMDDDKIQDALDRAQKELGEMRHGEDIEKVAALEATIAKATAALVFKRNRRAGK
jgi:F-type H+-transporting ATPase subunit epsilon